MIQFNKTYNFLMERFSQIWEFFLSINFQAYRKVIFTIFWVLSDQPLDFSHFNYKILSSAFCQQSTKKCLNIKHCKKAAFLIIFFPCWEKKKFIFRQTSLFSRQSLVRNRAESVGKRFCFTKTFLQKLSFNFSQNDAFVL